MEIAFDLNVSLMLSGGKASVNAEQLALLVRSIWNAGELQADGMRLIKLAPAFERLRAWVKEQSGVTPTDGELELLWRMCNDKDGNDPWSQKKRSWQTQPEKTPSSPPSTPDGRDPADPRYMPDPDDLTPSAHAA